jgi:hypothetical protein
VVKTDKRSHFHGIFHKVSGIFRNLQILYRKIRKTPPLHLCFCFFHHFIFAFLNQNSAILFCFHNIMILVIIIIIIGIITIITELQKPHNNNLKKKKKLCNIFFQVFPQILSPPRGTALYTWRQGGGIWVCVWLWLRRREGIFEILKSFKQSISFFFLNIFYGYRLISVLLTVFFRTRKYDFRVYF